jgi:hypothetical protein
MFSVMSLTNRLVYEKEFKDGKLYALSYLKKKDNAENGGKGSGSERTKACIDWYWQIWIDGILMDEWYAGTTCDGECAQPRMPSSGRVFSVQCSGGGGGGEQSWIEEESITGSGIGDDPSGVAPKINYYYHAVVVRMQPSGQIIGVTIVNTTVTNSPTTYIDQYGRGTTRYIAPFNHMNTWIQLTPFTVLVSWECFVEGTWVYTDGSPTHVSTWPKTRMQIHW